MLFAPYVFQNSSVCAPAAGFRFNLSGAARPLCAVHAGQTISYSRAPVAPSTPAARTEKPAAR